MSGYAIGMLTRAVIDGLLAQRKMDGDSDVFAPDDWRHLDAIIQQGKRAEARLRELGYEKQIEGAYKSGGVKYESPK